ncbi:PIN domain-containing protein [Mesorhizobium sp. BAC0120]|uniref:PIN domain-containing protein n=1 Tax=Mesorhizobium sp. BAC0120 TaxID=3090670 RepID=UPI00298CB41D|nr:PIN domain-containing protein [Mesorhizobium sp. BAC0120]MDW6020749.1 PIN domain-containing protein [Mesorhizobium sp. BAC0120]
MSLYLLDTNVISAIAPTKRRTASDEKLAAWIEANTDSLRLSVVSHAEVAAGIHKARRTGAADKAELLAEWWSAIRHYWRERFLPSDLQVAEQAGRLLDVARATGSDPGFEELAIAATAAAHGLTVLTRNTRHFQPLGIDFLNPFEALPPETSPVP